MSLTLGVPQMAIIAIFAIRLLGVAALHGEPCEPHNIFRATIQIAILAGVLAWGGFFS